MPLVFRGRPMPGWFRAVHVELAPGSQGAMVEHLQELLGTTVTGLFDAETSAALTAFQQDNSLAATGKCSIADWALLHPTVIFGDEMEAAKEIEWEFGSRPKGVVGTDVVEVIAAWQHHFNLPTDGRFDSDDYVVLLGGSVAKPAETISEAP